LIKKTIQLGSREVARKKSRSGKRYTKEEIQTINKMIADGASNHQIAAAVDRTKAAIRLYRYNGGPAKTVKRKSGASAAWKAKPEVLDTITKLKSKDRTVLVDLIVNSDVSKDAKLTCLEALL
jgi:hypothetical protein